jgi:hypoxanthine-guanine phosphoribosyltransferase
MPNFLFFIPQDVGFCIPERTYVVGFGLDFQENFRDLDVNKKKLKLI